MAAYPISHLAPETEVLPVFCKVTIVYSFEISSFDNYVFNRRVLQ